MRWYFLQHAKLGDVPMTASRTLAQKKAGLLVCSISAASIASNEIGWMGRETQACRNRGRVPTEIDRERRKSCFVKKVSGEGRGSCLVGSIQRELARMKAGLKARWAEMMDWV